MKAIKTRNEIAKLLKESKKKLQEDDDYARRAGTQLRPEIKAYRMGIFWALEWVLWENG